MCGIVGYIGRRPAAEILIEGLHRLEYRGYDSAGVAVVGKAGMQVVRSVGKVAGLSAKALGPDAARPEGSLGIAHTRWATHGPPSEANAHPHTAPAQPHTPPARPGPGTSLDGPDHRIAAVHNGIIENHQALRAELEKRGHILHSQTDSEVLPHLIEEFYQGDLCAAVAQALRMVEGTYGISVISADHPDLMVVARKGSPIAIGIGEEETIIASDVAAILAHTKRVIYLDDGDIATVSAKDVAIRNLDNIPVSREVATIDWEIRDAEKGGYEHFMLKEIFEQPRAIHNAIRGRCDRVAGSAILSGLEISAADIATIERMILAACGTSMHAAMVAEYFFEDLADLPTEVEQAAEFRYRNPIVNGNTFTLAISQSGETADTLAALREASTKGSQVAAICNVVGSTIAREAGRGVYLHAGPEISVASTKAFTCQVSVLLMMALKFARSRRLTRQQGLELVEAIEGLPQEVEQVLERAADIEAIARRWAHVQNMFFIGRGRLYPVALEGALKLKEISYIHAEGYQAAELKHGPIALLEETVPVVALANDPDGRDKMLANIEECRARNAPVIVVANDGDASVEGLSQDIIRLPQSHPMVTPVTTAVALQLFAYYIAHERGCSIDQPRNLAKSVTVE